MKVLNVTSNFLQKIPTVLLNNYPQVCVADYKNETIIESDKTIVLAEDLESTQVIEAVVNAKIYHLLQVNELLFSQDLDRAARLVESPEIYFSSFGLCLLNNVIKSHTIDFSNPSDKVHLKKESLEFVSKVKGAQLAESLGIIIEELYMNAVFDAPRLLQSQDSDPYLNGKKAKISLALSDQYLAVSCYDPYGTLDLKKFINRMNEVYQKGAGNVINQKKNAGSGIGCTILFEHSSSLFLGVIQNKATVVSCLLPVGLSAKSRAQIKKSLHLIQF